MATYLVLNCCFLLAAVLLLGIKPKRPSKAWLVTLVLLLVLTALFDSLIIMAGIVKYDPSKILGIYVGLAPVEDFFYALLAVVIVPFLWNKCGGSHARGA